MFLKNLKTFLVAAIATFVLQPRLAGANTLHLILCCDTSDDHLGSHAANNMINARSVFTNHIRTSQIRVTTLSENQASRAELLGAIRRCGAGVSDSLVVYYSGKGAFAANGSHVLTMQDGRDRVSRADVLNEMKKLKPRLACLFTDAYSDFYGKAHEKRFPPSAAAVKNQTAPLFDRLFFATSGVIDLNSVEKGSGAATYPDPRDGSVFTRVLCRELAQNSEAGNVSWDHILTSLDQGTRSEFATLFPKGRPVKTDTGEVANQREQRLGRFLIDIRGSEAVGVDGSTDGIVKSHRFGISVKNGSRGVVITDVDSNGPAVSCWDRDGKQWFAEVGDVIPLINGRSIRDVSDFADAVRSSPEEIRFALTSGMRSYTLSARLRSLNGGGVNTGGGTRFGCWVEERGNGNLVVTGVVADSPATRCSMVDGTRWIMDEGEIIARINGRRVTTDAEFREAIRTSPREMQLDVTSGKMTYRLKVLLAY